MEAQGAVGVFIGRFIPMIRTLIAIPAGILKMNFWEFTISSALGIFFWNLVLVIPSILGIITSIIARWIFSFFKTSKPSIPSAAKKTRYP